MSYIAPSGNATHLEFGVTTYSPPDGNAVALTFELPEIVGSASLAADLVVDATGVFFEWVTGYLESTIDAALSATGQMHIIGYGGVYIEPSLSALADQTPTGSVNIYLPLEVSSFGTITYDVSGKVDTLINVTLVADAAWFETIKIQVSVTCAGAIGNAGFGSIPIELTASATASRGASGTLTATLGLLTSGAATHSIGGIAAIAIDLELAAGGSFHTLCSGVMDITIPLRLVSIGDIGIAHSGTLTRSVTSYRRAEVIYAIR